MYSYIIYAENNILQITIYLFHINLLIYIYNIYTYKICIKCGESFATESWKWFFFPSHTIYILTSQNPFPSEVVTSPYANTAVVRLLRKSNLIFSLSGWFIGHQIWDVAKGYVIGITSTSASKNSASKTPVFGKKNK